MKSTKAACSQSSSGQVIGWARGVGEDIVLFLQTVQIYDIHLICAKFAEFCHIGVFRGSIGLVSQELGPCDHTLQVPTSAPLFTSFVTLGPLFVIS